MKTFSGVLELRCTTELFLFTLACNAPTWPTITSTISEINFDNGAHNQAC